MTIQIRHLFTWIVITGFLALSSASVHAANTESTQCEMLKGVMISPTPDASAQVTETKWVPPANTEPGCCQVGGIIKPTVEFLLRLPVSDWNGKFIHMGCGGPCGVLTHIPACDDPLRRGYACIISDAGHKTDPNDIVKWAENKLEPTVEYLVRSSHVTYLTGKALAQRYYNQAPRKSYFMGCSGGGVQAMFAAQRYPKDYDGIIAGGPALNVPMNVMGFFWMTRALTGADGRWLLGKSDFETLHQAVLKKCDMSDGVKDGVIGDPRECRFDPAEIRCDGSNAGQCLTPPQVEAVRKIYRGPTNSKGEQIAAPVAVMGSERHWFGLTGESVNKPTRTLQYMIDWYRYVLAQPVARPTWTPDQFDFDRDPAALGAPELFAPINPDLRRFKSGGGKLLMYTGWNDHLEGVLRTVDYYETVERTMGGRDATQQFLRLFVVPGADHCAGGDGTGMVDWLSALESWVERGQAPDSIVGAHVRTDGLDPTKKEDQVELRRRHQLPLDPAHVEFTRPIYPYPVRAKYLGRGDPNVASSFGPVKH